MLALVPASIIGRGFFKSANVPAAVRKADVASITAETLRHEITGGWHLYEVGGQSLFPVYGCNGGLCTRSMCWLVRQVKSGFIPYWESIPVEFNDLTFIAVGFDESAVKRIINTKIAEAIKNGKPVRVNMDGGNLPMHLHDRPISALLEEPTNARPIRDLLGLRGNETTP